MKNNLIVTIAVFSFYKVYYRRRDYFTIKTVNIEMVYIMVNLFLAVFT